MVRCAVASELLTGCDIVNETSQSVSLQPTVRANTNLRQVLGKFGTLAEGLDYAAQGQTGFNFYSGRGKLDYVLRYSELRERAVATAKRFLSLGLERGERVAVVAETTPQFMEVFFGCQYAGLVPCPMPYSMYIGGRAAYVERLKGMLVSADASVAVCSDELLGQVEEAGQAVGLRHVFTHDGLCALDGEGREIAPFGPDEVAYIQYSSGSTSSPKGVLITQKSIVNNAFGILNHGLQLTRDDRASSWLPLYHDMGLVGFCLSPMMGQITVDYMSTSAFARRPLLWLKIMSDNQCTIAYSPSFGYDLAARRASTAKEPFDLSSWRVAGIGGDMVRPDVLDRFAEAFGPSGFNARAFVPSYGMAESTLALTMAPLNEPVCVDRVDMAKAKISGKAVPVRSGETSVNTRDFVVCGVPLPGHLIEVRDDRGNVLGEREIGHVLVKGPSLMAGYYGNPDATQRIMTGDGWMATGDMGYMLDGQIVITGRSKDLILHNGRNIWPQDIEWAVEQIESLKSGDAAAFALEEADGSEHVVVLVQCRSSDVEEREALRREVSVVVHQQAGVECRIVLVPPRSLPFTSSGKLSRAGAKGLYLSGEICEIADPAVIAGMTPQAPVIAQQAAAD